MKIILQVCLLVVIHFTGFGNTLNTNNTTLKLPDNFYMKLKGKIGDKLSITMDIIKRRDTTNHLLCSHRGKRQSYSMAKVSGV